MKKRILITGLLVFASVAMLAAIAVGSRQLTKTNADVDLPVRLGAKATLASSFTVIGNKAARTANTGTVYIGVTSNNNAQPIAITSGTIYTFQAPANTYVDLYDWWLDVATANDGLVIIYTQ